MDAKQRTSKRILLADFFSADEPISLPIRSPLYRRSTSYERNQANIWLVWPKLPNRCGKTTGTTDTHFPEQRTLVAGLRRYVDGIDFGKVMDLLVSITVLTMTLLQRLKYDSKSTKRLVLGGLTLTFATQVNAHAKPTRRNPLSLIQPCFWFVGVCAWAYLCPHSMACGIDSTSVLSAFGCLEYSSTRSMFELTCSFGWSQRYHDCIVLQKHEVFEGHDHEINITGHSNWEGLFQIANSSSGRGPSSLTDAPVIRNVHIIGGETSQTGGFVVQSWQKHFIVDSCSSTGVIHGTTSGHWFGGGGICGHRCSGDIRITNCWSSGEIRGDVAGGIAGREVGINGNGYTVNITNCHSTGDIGGSMSGGICGHLAGQFNGRVTITHSYSTGTIIGYRSGGICGHGAGHTHGVVDISHCYTLGEIAGDQSGGIAGARAGETDGCLKISNSYSRGNVSSGSGAGGICGGQTAWRNGIVVIENVYSSGNIICATCSGILGSIGANGESANEVHIYRSVYNGENGAKDMVGDVHAKKYDSEHNSGDLGDITQKVYCYDDGDCWDTDTIWTVIPSDEFPILQFQVSRLLSTTTGIDANGRPVQESVVPCLHYEPANGTFFVSCAFNWTDWYFGRTEYIRLYKDETFDGQGYLIGLYGMVSWDGLFIIESNSGNAPSSLADAPVIRNVHIRGGETSHEGGFVVQSGQKHFSVESCSSTGVIQGMGESPWFGGGGICGQECSGDIRITNCWSSGEIRGDRAGGIAGRQIGVDGDGHTVNIMHCHSTGDIVGNFSGGICGNQAGRENGHVMITHSYSSGKIVGYGSGGICGIGAGRIHGEVEIKKCYSLGEINGPQSGGITGAYTANQNGHVSIANC